MLFTFASLKKLKTTSVLRKSTVFTQLTQTVATGSNSKGYALLAQHACVHINFEEGRKAMSRLVLE